MILVIYKRRSPVSLHVHKEMFGRLGLAPSTVDFKINLTVLLERVDGTELRIQRGATGRGRFRHIFIYLFFFTSDYEMFLTLNLDSAAPSPHGRWGN